MCIHNIMEVKIGNRRLKMIDGKICIVRFSKLGVEVKSGKFTPLNFCLSSNNGGYLTTNITTYGQQRYFTKHRLVWKMAHPDWDIFDSSQDNFIDHINRDKMDNSLENLRKVPHQHNTWNTNAKGCCFEKESGKWRAKITLNYKDIYLGKFDTEEEAHTSYLQAKLKYHVIV